jgi:hypothetical protein
MKQATALHVCATVAALAVMTTTTAARAEDSEPATTFPVSFSASSANDKYNVVVTTATGERKTCDAPCSLDLAAGKTHLSVSGARTYEQDIVVEAKPMNVSLYHACNACLPIAGGLVAGGLVFMLIGQTEFQAANCTASSAPDCDVQASGHRGGGYLFTGFGVLMIAGGLTTAGVRLFQGSPRAEVRSRASAPVRVESVGLAPASRGSGATGGVTLSF